MTLRDVGAIIKLAPPLAPDDTVAKAVRLLRARSLPALPDGDQGRHVGLVHDTDLIRLVSGVPDPRAAAQAIPVARIMRPIELILSETQPLSSVAEALSGSAAPAAPVAASDGRYLGLLLSRDLLAAIAGEPLAPPIAGLATPFGVYLTTGALRAGANDLALAATGAALMAINLLASGALYGLASLADRFLSHGAPPPPPEPTGPVPLWLTLGLYGLQIAVFLLFLRLSPLTGIHGAEHMVVHAIEEGEELIPEKLKAMPRVHPRCGTNLMALLILLVIAQQSFSKVSAEVNNSAGILAFFLLAMIVFLSWRRLGAALQRWVTTRRPSDRQLAQATRVGQALLEKVRACPGARAAFPRRLWNTGFPQVLAGFLAVALVVEYGGPLLTTAWSWLSRL
jgi:CBS domain-containing protein